MPTNPPRGVRIDASSYLLARSSDGEYVGPCRQSDGRSERARSCSRCSAIATRRGSHVAARREKPPRTFRPSGVKSRSGRDSNPGRADRNLRLIRGPAMTSTACEARVSQLVLLRFVVFGPVWQHGGSRSVVSAADWRAGWRSRPPVGPGSCCHVRAENRRRFAASDFSANAGIGSAVN